MFIPELAVITNIIIPQNLRDEVLEIAKDLEKDMPLDDQYFEGFQIENVNSKGALLTHLLLEDQLNDSGASHAELLSNKLIELKIPHNFIVNGSEERLTFIKLYRPSSVNREELQWSACLNIGDDSLFVDDQLKNKISKSSELPQYSIDTMIKTIFAELY
ncbi:hypothetical protein [Acinetobacter sp. P1(2025)]|uniref:hypothetical protein n=1 Tax=Acinetobacter sp. P1(2025) TaxID=3446120 RepID=UPI003F53A4D0